MKSIVIGLAILSIFPSSLSAGQGHFTFGLQGGLFVPHNWPIQDQVESWNGGFGKAFEFGGYCGYYITDFEIMIKFCERQSVTDRKLRNSNTNYQRNTLQDVSFDFSLIYHLILSNKSIQPYIGLGTGFNFANWKQ